MENHAPSDGELLEYIVNAYRSGDCAAALFAKLEAISEWWSNSNRPCQIQHCSIADRPRDPMSAKADAILKKFNLL